jgi:hypothetical protein
MTIKKKTPEEWKEESIEYIQYDLQETKARLLKAEEELQKKKDWVETLVNSIGSPPQGISSSRE